MADLRSQLLRLLFFAFALALLVEAAVVLPFTKYARESAGEQCTVLTDLAVMDPQYACCPETSTRWLCARGGFRALAGRLAVGTVFLFLTACSFLALAGRLRAAALITSGICLALAFSHAVKLHFLGEPVYISDFFPSTLMTFASVIGGLAWPVQAALALAMFLLALPFCFAWRSIRRQSAGLNPKRRALTGAFAILVIWALCNESGGIALWRYASRLQVAYLNTTQNFFNLGPVGFWLYELPRLASPPVAPRYPKDMPAPAHDTAARKPDVFVILAESLWDPGSVSMMQHLRDPLPFFHRQVRTNGGYLQVPAQGGGTAKTEFEVLTGLTSLDIDGFPYVSALRQPTRSLATVFRRSGYRTIYAHAYRPWMFNRNRAMPRLGFEKIIFEEDITRGAPADPQPADLYMRDSVFLKYLCSLPRGETAHFISAATYGTHGPYYNRQTVAFALPKIPALKPGEEKILANNLALLRQFDNALGEFFSCLGRSGRPTVVLVYGDHWPNYSYLDFTRILSDEPKPTFSRTAYFFAAVNLASPFRAEQLTSTNWLHLDIQKAAGIGDDAVNRSLREIRNELPVLGVYKKSRTMTSLSRSLPPGDAVRAAQEHYAELSAAVLGEGFGLK